MKVELFFDCSSPWAYLGFECIQRLAPEIGLDVRFRPVLVGGIFNKVNRSIYHIRANVPAKIAYNDKDIADWSRITGIEIHFPPPVFPVNSAKAMRACLLLEPEGHLVAFARATFEAYWRDHEDISRTDVLAAICERIGIDPAGVIPQLNQQTSKDLLSAATDEAIERGAFGVPTFFLNETDMYFGVDRLHNLRFAVERLRGASEPGSSHTL
jgi:2-hydroxychromene-2-carboxylate isomerase